MAASVGRTFRSPTTYVVTREKIREFVDAIGAPEPAHRDPAAARELGHADVIAPPTFAAAMSIDGVDVLRQNPEIGIDHRRAVHAAQRYTYLRPICAGDELTCSATIVERLDRSSAVWIIFEMTFETVAGECVAMARVTLAARP